MSKKASGDPGDPASGESMHGEPSAATGIDDQLIDLLSLPADEVRRRRAASQLDPQSLRQAEQAAAVYSVASLPKIEALPAALESRLLEDAKRFARASAQSEAPSARAAPGPPPAIGRSRWFALSGYALAASIAVLAVLLRPLSPQVQPGVPAQPLVGKQALHVAWTPGPDATGAQVSGQVVWDPQSNRGYMVFKGLAANDAARQQYQLWVFDAQRDARYPVDGGVFNVADGQAEIRVPITPKLHVGQATAFVVTVEKPGGVVVSDRSRVAAVATVG